MSERDEFGRAVAKMAVTQICKSVGFQSFQASAIETLADIAIRYLRDLAKAAHYYSNLASRIESNAFDVAMALEDFGPGVAVADTQRPISRSVALREVMKYVEYNEEVPFGRPLPRFPLPRKRAANPSFAQLNERPPSAHIPLWLPAFPDPHTYKHSPVMPEKKREPAASKVEQARQRRKAESSLVALHSRFAATTSYKENHQHQQQQQLQLQKVADGKNPFLLPATEGEVSAIMFGGANDGLPSIAEAFAAVVESGAEANGLDLQEGSNSLAVVEAPTTARPLPASNNRARVVLTFDFGGKMGSKGAYASKVLGVDRDSKRRKIGGVREEENDERQRRAEQILSQSMEHVSA